MQSPSACATAGGPWPEWLIAPGQSQSQGGRGPENGLEALHCQGPRTGTLYLGNWRARSPFETVFSTSLSL